MAEEETKWNPTCKRFVAFLDIMGFRDMVFREGHDKVLKKLGSFQIDIEVIEDYAKRTLSGKITKPDEGKGTDYQWIVKPILFSDSIILISFDETPPSAISTLYNAGWILEHAIMNRIPIKGAMAYGMMTAEIQGDSPLYFGQPLIDAYELQKELKLYGVVLHHTMEEQIEMMDKYLVSKNMKPIFENNWVLKYETPFNSRTINHLVLNWLTKPDLKEEVIKSIPQLIYTVSGPPRKYVDNTIKYVHYLKEIGIIPKEIPI